MTTITVLTAGPAHAQACPAVPNPAVGNRANCRNMDLRQPADQFNNQNYTLGRFMDSNFEGMTLVNANFSRANFEGANLRGVKFRGATLDNAFLHLADMRGATFDALTTLNNANVTRTKGLMPLESPVTLHTGKPTTGEGMEPRVVTSDRLKPADFPAGLHWDGCQDRDTGATAWGVRQTFYSLSCRVRDSHGGIATGTAFLLVRE
ncbi:pentapeptide repeat-containing protein [Mycobacterium haemophilum]